MEIYVPYDRFSGKPQELGSSKERQDRFVQATAARMGWTPHPTLSYRDPGVSARRGRHRSDRRRGRGGLADLLADVKQGTIEPQTVIVIECFNRLSREPLNSAFNTFQNLLHSGVRICMCRPFRVYTTADLDNYELMQGVLAAMNRAHEESEEKAVWAREAWVRRHREAAEGRKTHGRKGPHWLTRTPAGWVLPPERAAIIRALVSWARAGMGVRAILKRLASDPARWPAWGPSGRWSLSYVGAVLRSPALWGGYQRTTKDAAGKVIPLGEPIPDYYPGVVTRDEFDALQRTVHSRQRRHIGRPTVGGMDLLQHMVRDAQGYGYGRRRRYHRGYEYVVLMREVTQACRRGVPLLCVPYEPVQYCVLHLLPQLKLSDIRPAAAGDAAHEADLARLKAAREKIDAALASLQGQLNDGDFGPETLPELVQAMRALKAKRAEVEDQRALVQSAGSATAEAALASARSLVTALDAATGDERLGLLEQLRPLLPAILEGVWIHVQPITRMSRWVHVQLWLKSGRCVYSQLHTGCRFPGGDAHDLSGVDFRLGYPEPLPPAPGG